MSDPFAIPNLYQFNNYQQAADNIHLLKKKPNQKQWLKLYVLQKIIKGEEFNTLPGLFDDTTIANWLSFSVEEAKVEYLSFCNILIGRLGIDIKPSKFKNISSINIETNFV